VPPFRAPAAFAIALVATTAISASVACRRSPTSAPADSVASTADGDTPAPPAPPPPKPGETPKLASKAMETWIYEQPSSSSTKLGYLRAGSIVERKNGPVGKKDCPGGWYGIAPRGYVCVGKDATLDLNDPIVTASSRRPELTAGLPYGYAVVRNAGAPFYTRIPTPGEAKTFEPDWDHHFRTLEEAEHDESVEGSYPQLSSLPTGSTLASGEPGKFPLEPAPGVLASWATDGKDDPIPFFLQNGNFVPNLSGLAWSGRTAYEGGTSCPTDQKNCIPLDAARPKKRLGVSFIDTIATADRRFLLTTDLLLMPADRVRLVRGTSFHGVELGEGKGLDLPVVVVKREGAKRYTIQGKKMVAGDALGWRSVLKATSKQRVFGGVHYHELEDGSFVSDKDGVRLDPIKKMPKWAKDGERWIEINIAKQTLLAVDGQRPVYATLVSTGAGGLESAETSPYVTPRGIFRIHTKHVAATMDSKQPEAEFELRDVPYIQYFKDGYALHAAYWHDQFGTPRSHGCINLAPIDAKWLFQFTKPEVPPGWHGVLLPLKGTVVWIHA
jgi:hypothetical protein